MLGNINVQYSPSGQVARRLGVSHRTLGRMTGAPRAAPARQALAVPFCALQLLPTLATAVLFSTSCCPQPRALLAPSPAGNVWLQAGEERRDRVDVGLCVKNGGKGLYVPDFARPFMEAGDAKGERGGGWHVAFCRPWQGQGVAGWGWMQACSS